MYPYPPNSALQTSIQDIQAPGPWFAVLTKTLRLQSTNSLNSTPSCIEFHYEGSLGGGKYLQSSWLDRTHNPEVQRLQNGLHALSEYGLGLKESSLLHLFH